MQTKIVILGGTGLIGQALKTQLASQFEIVTYGRQAFQSLEQLKTRIEDAHIIIQLSGANIGQRWSKGYEQTLWNSRIETTKMLAQAIAQRQTKPAKVICASAIGFYPENTCENPVDETQTTAGQNFLAELSLAWEAQAEKLAPKANLIITRFGVVLDKHQGALAKMLPAFKLGLGGPVAGGKQCFSWIHIQDLTRAIAFLLDQPDSHGVYNLTAPNPLAQKAFAKILGKTLHRPAILPLPAWQLKLMFGKGAQVLMHSSAVLPGRLKKQGFEFEFPDATLALKDLLDPC